MEYSEIKRAVLELIDQYSVGGEEISLAYHNHSDDVHRIPNLINQALMDIRTGVLPECAVCRFGPDENESPAEIETRSGEIWLTHTLPVDFWRLRSGGVRKLEKSGPCPTNQYRLLGKKGILTPPGTYLVEYDRYPDQLPANPPDNYVLREDPQTLQAACLYAAAVLATHDDEFTCAALYNAYESRLARLTPARSAEVRTVEDAYQFFG